MFLRETQEDHQLYDLPTFYFCIYPCRKSTNPTGAEITSRNTKTRKARKVKEPNPPPKKKRPRKKKKRRRKKKKRRKKNRQKTLSTTSYLIVYNCYVIHSGKRTDGRPIIVMKCFWIIANSSPFLDRKKRELFCSYLRKLNGISSARVQHIFSPALETATVAKNCYSLQ